MDEWEKHKPLSSLVPGISIPDFVLQLWRKLGKIFWEDFAHEMVPLDVTGNSGSSVSSWMVSHLG